MKSEGWRFSRHSRGGRNPVNRKCRSVIHRSVQLSSLEKYLKQGGERGSDLTEMLERRQELLVKFPYPVMLELSYPELDFTNRWCWNRWGSFHGHCYERSSEYPACAIEAPHSHIGVWATIWFVKTAYDFGFNEWYFSTDEAQNEFLDSQRPGSQSA